MQELYAIQGMCGNCWKGNFKTALLGILSPTVRYQPVDRSARSCAVAKTGAVIENKFHAGVSDGQLADYLAYAKLRFPEPSYTLLPIFLTLANEEPSEDIYLLLGYEDVLDIIEHLLEFNKKTSADALHDFYHFILKS